MSIGISIYPDDSKDPIQLIKQADEALYYLKKHKKGEIKFYNSLDHESENVNIEV
jgi:GGDEF domain-containing protein